MAAKADFSTLLFGRNREKSYLCDWSQFEVMISKKDYKQCLRLRNVAMPLHLGAYFCKGLTSCSRGIGAHSKANKGGGNLL